jgi:GNAT superfamily N-acetyltransferase
MVGLAEAQPAVAAPGWVEIAVSVHPPYRRRGLGRRLVAATVAIAFERGAEVAEFFFDPDNRPIIALVLSLGARIDTPRDRAEMRRTDAARSPGGRMEHRKYCN